MLPITIFKIYLYEMIDISKIKDYIVINALFIIVILS